jgi:non-specific serine/threonine protein kinase
VAVDLGIPGIDQAEAVARGGFGVVYRAHQGAFDRNVAVKVISGLEFDEDAKRLFVNECRALGRLSEHPAIVQVFDAGISSYGQAYVVMQFVSGGTLAKQLLDGPLAGDDLLKLANALIDGLSAAHDAGVLHLDVKPENVLINRFGYYVLTDFGIARLTDSTRAFYRAEIAGTPGYVAPEVVDGARPSVAADIYGIGAVLFAAATGNPPHPMRTEEGLLQYLARLAREPTPVVPDTIAGNLRWVIQRSIARDPAERFQSCAEMRHALTELSPPMSLPRLETIPDQWWA